MWRRRLGLPLLRSRSSSYQQQQHHHHLLPNPNEKPLALNLLRLFTSQAGSDSSSFIKPFIAFVLGGPGSGKGTQCSRIASNFGFAHLSAGDLLRNEISSGSEKGELILDIIKEGRIVPSEITVELIRKAMESSNTKRVLIDGFPRCEENRIAFERMIGTEPDLVIFFDCPEDEMVKRLLGRNQARGVGARGRRRCRATRREAMTTGRRPRASPTSATLTTAGSRVPPTPAAQLSAATGSPSNRSSAAGKLLILSYGSVDVLQLVLYLVLLWRGCCLRSLNCHS